MNTPDCEKLKEDCEFELTSPDHDDGEPAAQPYGLGLECEREIVAAVLADERWLRFASRHLNPKQFANKAHKTALELAADYYNAYRRIIPTTILKAEFDTKLSGDKAKLAHLGELEAVAGAYEPGLFPADYWKDRLVALARRHAAGLAINAYFKAIEAGEALPETHLSNSLIEASQITFVEDDKVWFTDADIESLPDQDWLVADHLTTGGLLTIFAPSNTGKTFFVMDLAYSVAHGMPFLGRFATRQGKVAYVYSEGRSGVKLRAKAWRHHHEKPASENIAFLPTTIDLSDHGHTTNLLVDKLDGLFGGPPDLVVIDTLSDNFGAGDTDKNQDMRLRIALSQKLRDEYGCAVVFIHHTGWGDEDRERGAKTLRDGCDTVIGLKTHKDYDDRIVVSCKKQREGEKWNPYTVSKKLVYPDGKKCLVLVPDETDAQTDTDVDRLLAAVPITTDPNEGRPLKMLMTMTNLSRTTCQRRLDELEAEKQIGKELIGKTLCYFRLA